MRIKTEPTFPAYEIQYETKAGGYHFYGHRETLEDAREIAETLREEANFSGVRIVDRDGKLCV